MKHWLTTWPVERETELEAVRKINALPFADPIEPRYNEAVGWATQAEIDAFGTYGYISTEGTYYEN